MPTQTIEHIPTASMAQAIQEAVSMYDGQRKRFERRWYDNNFFDDGYHFRYVSRTTGKIIDSQDKAQLNIPTRSIPKASRQIRGVANLLLQPEYVPVIYPEKIMLSNFDKQEQYKEALELAKNDAKKIGHWVTEEWEDQELFEKIMHMILLTSKNGISYLQTWPDPVREELRTQVFDAFDVYLAGQLTDIEDCPEVIKVSRQNISEIMANEMFDESAREDVIPDNKYAQSQVKESYMIARFGTLMETDEMSTALVSEQFKKEYLNDNNWNEAKKMGEKNGALENKKKGDLIMRHTFVAGGQILLDEYIRGDTYPLVDFRMEPGPLYQVPIIERFIPANKTLDTVMSRVERWINTMSVGIYQKRKGENFIISNKAGGQIIEYEGTPLSQMNVTNLPNTIWQFIKEINSIIEEQGQNTSALGQLPPGVKSGVAIESLKATEYANLKTAASQLKKTVRRISERMICMGSYHFMNPRTVMHLEENEPSYFDIVGIRGIESRDEINQRSPYGVEPLENVVVLNPDKRVKIEVESGLGFTMEGKKNTMQQIIEYIAILTERGLVGTEALKIITKRFLDIFQFGSTQEFMDAFEQGMQTNKLSEQQMNQMKIAVAEVLKDTGAVGPKKDEADIQKSKIGTVEGLKDLANAKPAQPQPNM